MMNNNQHLLFAAILLEEDEKRNYLRVLRRSIRDEINVFEMPDVHFKQLFRLNKHCVLDLIESLQQHANTTGNIPFHLKVLATLHFLGTGSYQNPVGSNLWLALSQSSISRAVYYVCHLMTRYLLPVWVKFPATVEEKNQNKLGFFQKWGCRGVLGVIDGTHVEIIAPSMTDADHPPYVYINRKGRHSINVMLISDSNTRIIGCCARYPGSVHDAAVWQMSSIRQFLRTKYDEGDKLSHLIGDSGYPLEPWLFTPIQNVIEGTPEARFNSELNSTRNVIERTNGILKGRFRCLSRHRVLNYHPSRAANIIYAACILHNIACAAGINIAEEEIEYRDDDVHAINVENNVQDIFHLGREARNAYIRHNL